MPSAPLFCLLAAAARPRKVIKSGRFASRIAVFLSLSMESCLCLKNNVCKTEISPISCCFHGLRCHVQNHSRVLQRRQSNPPRKSLLPEREKEKDDVASSCSTASSECPICVEILKPCLVEISPAATEPDANADQLRVLWLLLPGQVLVASQPLPYIPKLPPLSTVDGGGGL